MLTLFLILGGEGPVLSIKEEVTSGCFLLWLPLDR